MKTIIAATDFSEEGENTLAWAGALAQKLKAKLVVFSSFTLTVATTNSLLPANSIVRMQTQDKRLLQQKAQEMAKAYGIPVDCECAFMAEVEDELEELYAKHQADLVIMGGREHSLLQELFGNTTTDAIHKLKFPVLVVPPKVAYKGIKKMLYACDAPADAPQNILERIGQLAAALKAELEIFHVQRQQSQAVKETLRAGSSHLEECLKGVNHQFKCVDAPEVIEAIELELKQTNADLLVMVPHKYGFWDSLLHRSKTRKMASKSNVPMLSIPF